MTLSYKEFFDDLEALPWQYSPLEGGTPVFLVAQRSRATWLVLEPNSVGYYSNRGKFRVVYELSAWAQSYYQKLLRQNENPIAPVFAQLLFNKDCTP